MYSYIHAYVHSCIFFFFLFLFLGEKQVLYESIINYTVASIDVALPTMFILVWICFTLMYAGFPYRSSRAAYVQCMFNCISHCIQ
jgi:hypothetical protein